MKVGKKVNVGEFGVPASRALDPAGEAYDREVTFRRTLTSMGEDQHREHLAGLMDKIDKQAKKLAQRADIAEFEKYRGLIRDFIDEVVSNGYAFGKDTAFGSRGRHRFYATVRTIDEKLEEMAKEVLRGQADSISLLHKIDDIRGLILDMML